MQHNFVSWRVPPPSAKRSLTQKTTEDPYVSVGEGFQTILQHWVNSLLMLVLHSKSTSFSTGVCEAVKNVLFISCKPDFNLSQNCTELLQAHSSINKPLDG